MAEPQTISQRIGLTRGKAVTIGLLAVALVGVIYIQYGRTSGDEMVPVAAHAPPSHRTQRSETQNATASTQPQQQTNADLRSAIAAAFNPVIWKSPDVSTVVAYDPFALPGSFPRALQTVLDPRLAEDSGSDASAASADGNELAAAIEALRLELEALQQRGVQVIVRGRDRYVAMIGDRMVHVGDEINGFTVTAIEPDGVRVERKVDP